MSIWQKSKIKSVVHSMYTDENLIRLSCVSAEIEIACIVVFYCLSLKILVYKLQSRSQVYIKIWDNQTMDGQQATHQMRPTNFIFIFTKLVQENWPQMMEYLEQWMIYKYKWLFSRYSVSPKKDYWQLSLIKVVLGLWLDIGHDLFHKQDQRWYNDHKVRTEL